MKNSYNKSIWIKQRQHQVVGTWHYVMELKYIGKNIRILCLIKNDDGNLVPIIDFVDEIWWRHTKKYFYERIY